MHSHACSCVSARVVGRCGPFALAGSGHADSVRHALACLLVRFGSRCRRCGSSPLRGSFHADSVRHALACLLVRFGSRCRRCGSSPLRGSFHADSAGMHSHACSCVSARVVVAAGRRHFVAPSTQIRSGMHSHACSCVSARVVGRCGPFALAGSGHADLHPSSVHTTPVLVRPSGRVAAGARRASRSGEPPPGSWCGQRRRPTAVRLVGGQRHGGGPAPARRRSRAAGRSPSS